MGAGDSQLLSTMEAYVHSSKADLVVMATKAMNTRELQVQLTCVWFRMQQKQEHNRVVAHSGAHKLSAFSTFFLPCMPYCTYRRTQDIWALLIWAFSKNEGSNMRHDMHGGMGCR